MTPDRHARIHEIFNAALELPSESRTAYLDAACSGDTELRNFVANLIEADSETVTEGGPRDRTRFTFVRECPRCSRCFDSTVTECPEDGAELDVAFQGSLLIGGKYRIERRLGSGGMGSVFLATHVGLEKKFALKLMNVEGPIPASYRARFETEALALGRMKHPAIVDVTDYGIDERGGGLPYLVMEYIEGPTLRQELKDRKCFDPRESLRLLRAIAAGVDAAHAKGIVHGDLKPANALAGPKIVDFGLASLPTSAPAASLGSFRGTPAYMAPELYRREDATPASDRFAFGVMAYEFLTGDVPFGRNMMEVARNLADETEAPSHKNKSLPVELDQPVLALMNRDPANRPASAIAAIEAMEAAWIASRRREWREREVLKRAGIAAAVAALVVLIAMLASKWGAVESLEERTIDWRFATLAKHAPDPRLIVVALDDRTLAKDPRPLASMDAEFASMIEKLFAAGARAVAIDILLPDWSASQAFGNAVAAHADRLTLAKFSGKPGVIGPECVGRLTALMLGPEKYDALFGFVNLEPDEDRRIRRGRATFEDGSASFAKRMVEKAGLRDAHGVTWIDYSVRPADIPLISWSEVESVGFGGKTVLLGATYSASGDEHRVPDHAGVSVAPGSVIQALIANSILEGFSAHAVEAWRTVAAIGGAVLAVMFVALRWPHRPSWAQSAIVALCFGYAAFAFAIFRWKLAILVLVAPEIAIVLTAIALWRIPKLLSPYPGMEAL